MRIFALLAIASCCFAAIGDKAPSVPSGYVTSHPRLGAPDSTYLSTIWAARPTAYGGTNGATRIWDAADAFNGASPVGTKTGLVNCRYLLLAYLAEKANSGARTATYLGKIQTLGANITSMAPGYGGTCAALAYDWTYADLGSTAQANYRSAMYSWMSTYESSIVNESPYNDQYYITGGYQTYHLLMALAIYPDDASTSLPHLRFAMDQFKNQMLPVWRQVMGGESGCGASAASSNDCGGGWHESSVYQNTGGSSYDYIGLSHRFLPYILAWKNATGEDLFTTEPWIKNYGWYWAYMVRPDWRMSNIPMTSFGGVPDSEYPSGLHIPASLNGLAEVYNDPVMRQWARTFNNSSTDGFEPSAWPYYAPDSTAKTVSAMTNLSKIRNFPGWGVAFFRTNAPGDENGTACWLKYGANFWSHTVQDAGGFDCYNRGELNPRTGDYRPGTNSRHVNWWYSQAVSQNALLISDPSDAFALETYATADRGGSFSDAAPNDGGQRRVGSGWSNVGGGEMQQASSSPLDRAQWERSRELYEMGTLSAFTVGTSSKWAYAAVDLTKAYNNYYSAGAHSASFKLREANSVNRTQRASKVVRHFLWIPRAGTSSTSAYAVIYDQVVSTDSTFAKKNVLHFVNSPTVSNYTVSAFSGVKWTATRTETVTGVLNGNSWPYPFLSKLPSYSSGSFQYIYNGKTYGYLTMAGASPGASTSNITTIGGSGSQFKIGATNYDGCLDSTQCTAGELGGDGFVAPLATNWSSDIGSYRIEQSPTASNKEDWFVNVILYTTNSDTNVVSTEPSTSASGNNFVTTWKDAADGCTYTLTVPKYGVGGTITATGAASTCPGI